MSALGLVLWLGCAGLLGGLGYCLWALHQIRCQSFYHAGLLMGEQRAKTVYRSIEL